MSDGAPAGPDLEAAAEWLVTIRSGEASESDMAAFQSWLQSSPSNIAACRSVEQTFLRMPSLGGVGGGAVRDVLLKPSGRRAFMRQTFGFLAVAGVSGALYAGRRYPLATLGADLATPTGERSVSMVAGGVIHLDAGSAADTRDGVVLLRTGGVAVDNAGSGRIAIDREGVRLVPLGAGRVYAMVQEDGTSLLGTTGVACVVKGRGIDTMLPSARTAMLVGRSGDAAAVPARGGETAWIGGMIEAHDEELSSVVWQIRRYLTDVIVLTESARSIRVSGRFSLDRVSETLDAMAEALPIRVRRLPGILTVIDAA